MRKRILLAIAGSLTLFIAQCANSPSDNQTEGSGSKSVRIAISTPAHFDTIAASARVRVSANDMSRVIEQPLSILDTQITGVVSQIPAGYNRKFEVFVYGYDSTVRYYGSAYADISVNDTTLVSIILRKPGGTAIISGYIEDMFIPRDSISQPATPYIDNYEVYSTNPNRSIISLKSNGSISFDSCLIGYKWNFLRFNPITKDSAFYILDLGSTTFSAFNNTTYFNDTFPADGIYRVTISGYSIQNPQIISPFSNALVYEIKNGLLVDSVNQIDSVPPVLTLIGSDTIRIAPHDTFFDPGVSAFDNVDGNLSYKISKSGYVNTSNPGVYSLYYSVSDRAGNSATIVRCVIVISTLVDRISPVINLFGSQWIYLGVNDTFIEPGFTAYDNVDGDITSKVTVRYSTPRDSGSMRIIDKIYSVTDAAGNMANAYRQIIYSSQETLSQPVKPFIISTKQVKSPSSTRVIEFATNSIVTSSGDSVFYDWTIKSPLDTAFTKSTTTTLMQYTFKNKGLYAITVRARCRIHSAVQSQNSLPLWIDSSDSVVVDSLIAVR